MSWLDDLRLRARGLFRRKRVEDELDDELRFHLEKQIEANLAAGMSRGLARERALQQFGGTDQAKEECRDARGTRFVDEFLQDLRFGVRLLRKNPGFAAVAVLTLALGIGANTAVFSVVYAVLFRSLPYPAPKQLVILSERQLQGGTMSVTWPNFLDWRAQNRSFTAMAAYQQVHYDLSGVPEPTLLRGATVTADIFPLLGAEAQLGRTFSPADDHPGATPVAILSHALWTHTFAADPATIGRTIVLTGKPYLVVGILNPGFEFFQKPTDVWIPLGLSADSPGMQNRARHQSLRVLARLRPGVSLAAARTDMDALSQRLALAYPESNAGHGASLTPLFQQRLGDIAPSLYTLFAAAGVALLIVCVNLANLVLARVTNRRKELAVRASLGAGRARMVRQMLAEGLALSLLGGVAGFALAAGIVPALIHLAPASIPRLNEVRVDWSMFAFGLGVSMLAGIFFSLLPALHATRMDVNASLKESAASMTSGRSQNSLRAALLVGEVALAVVLTIASGLFVRSLVKTLAVNPGFDPANVLSLDVILLNPKYSARPQRWNFYQTALERLRALPGVRQAGAVMCPPLNETCWDWWYSLSDRPAPAPSELPLSRFNIADTGYFRALQIPLIEGREFTDADTAQAAPVAIVNQAFARKWWLNSSGLGTRILYGGPQTHGNQVEYEIVGVVGDVRQDGLDTPTDPEVFLPLAQNAGTSMVFMVRASDDPMRLAADAEAQIHQSDKDLPVRMARATQSVSTALASREFSTALMGVFAALALLLAAIGTYGVMSYGVAQRTQEIGIRMALGAQRLDVLLLVVRRGLGLVLLGTAIGLGAAVFAARLLRGMLFGVSPADPVSFAAVTVLLVAVALAASYLPARRAAKVDPIISLRYQ